MAAEINVIDLFAGPGGLGEGFAAFRQRGSRFKIRMSVEMEPSAHKTLELRAFVRQFSKPPKYYYEYVRGAITREELFNRYAGQAAAARSETLGAPRTLGDKKDDALVHKRLRGLKKEHGGRWVVVGGPPCQAYSLVGRARNRGKKGYKPETDERNFLYEEYLKVLTLIRPDVFVMENVPGILSANVGGEKIFPRIVNELSCPDRALGRKKGKNAEYRIYSLATGQEMVDPESEGRHCRIRSEEYGVPQARHRVILLGVRCDMKDNPGILKKAKSTVALRDVIRDLPELRSGLSPKRLDSFENWSTEVAKQAQRVARELNRVDLKTHKIGSAVARTKRLRNRGGRFVEGNQRFKGPTFLQHWYKDRNLGGHLNHRTKRHMPSDLGRYLYCTSYALQKKGRSPRSHDFPEKFAPDHESWEKGDFADRFKVQAWNRPAATITSHIAKDGHANIHPDPGQCRSLTVREAARLQTFPDNYFFEGNRTQQYVQVGNAVPPWLANQIARIVNDLLD